MAEAVREAETAAFERGLTQGRKEAAVAAASVAVIAPSADSPAESSTTDIETSAVVEAPTSDADTADTPTATVSDADHAELLADYQELCAAVVQLCGDLDAQRREMEARPASRDTEAETELREHLAAVAGERDAALEALQLLADDLGGGEAFALQPINQISQEGRLAAPAPRKACIRRWLPSTTSHSG
jgi:hypothetical protein